MPIRKACLSCNHFFTTVLEMQTHCASVGHQANPYVCMPCNSAFKGLMQLQMHLNSLGHGRRFGGDTVINPNIRHVCPTCSKSFLTEMRLQQHNDSKTHLPRVHKCPFCPAAYKSPSGVAHHLESGFHGNNPTITRHQVTAVVKAMQIVPNICVNPLPATNEDVDMEVGHRPGQREGDGAGESNTLIFAMPSFLNGEVYQCLICFRAFRTPYSLTKHMDSAAHDADEFRCPKCKREFTLVSGFIQHLESQVCGLSQMTQISGYFDDLSGQFARAIAL